MNKDVNELYVTDYIFINEWLNTVNDSTNYFYPYILYLNIFLQ